MSNTYKKIFELIEDFKKADNEERQEILAYLKTGVMFMSMIVWDEKNEEVCYGM